MGFVKEMCQKWIILLEIEYVRILGLVEVLEGNRDIVMAV